MCNLPQVIQMQSFHLSRFHAQRYRLNLGVHTVHMAKFECTAYNRDWIKKIENAIEGTNNLMRITLLYGLSLEKKELFLQ